MVEEKIGARSMVVNANGACLSSYMRLFGIALAVVTPRAVTTLQCGASDEDKII